MPIDPTIFLRGYQGSVDPTNIFLRAKQQQQDQQLRALQIQGAQQDTQTGALKLSELGDQIAKQKAIEGAAKSSLSTPAPVNVPQAPVNVGGVSIPGNSTTVQGPPQFDPQKFQQAYQGIDPIGAMGYQQAQQANQMKAQSMQADTNKAIAETKEALSKANDNQLSAAGNAFELMGKVLTPVLSLPPEQKQQAWQQGVSQLVQQGVMPPDQAQQHAQYPGDQALGSQLMATKAGTEYIAQRRADNELKSKTVNTGEGVKQFNPATGAFDVRVGSSPKSAVTVSDNLLSNPDALSMAAEYYRKTGTLPSGFSRSPQTVSAVISKAAEMAKAEGGSADIAANKITYNTANAENKYMTSGKGGQQLTAFNTAISHLSTLDNLASQLNNGDIQIFNKAAQAWAQQTGNPAPTNFAAAKNAMSGEVAAALKASGATDQEINKVGDTFDRAQSPAQLKGAIEAYRSLLGSKRDQLKAQHDAAQQGKPNFGDNAGGAGSLPPLTITLPSGKKVTIGQ